MEGDPIRVVISYRRDDAAGHAGHLYADLVRHFGEDRVFIDIDNIEPGLDFAEVITDAIDSADVLLAVIGRTWLSAADRNGRRKIDKPDDFVRLELEAAIARKLRIVPVLVQDAEMPSAEDLPESLATFSRRHALEISDKRWRDDVDELCELLEQIARAKAGRQSARRAAAERSAGEAAPRGVQPAPPDGQERRRVEQEQPALREAQRSRQEREAHLVHTSPVPPVPPVPSGPAGTRRAPPPYPPTGPGPPAIKGWILGTAAAVVVLGLVLALVALGSGGGGDGDGAGEQAVVTEPDPPAIVETVEVRSDVAWNDTGVDVVAGQRVEIVASGTIETARGDRSRDSQPDGKPGEEHGNNVLPGVRHGALIGMIGGDAPFEVGAYSLGPAPGSGRLYLGVNDRGIENNAGEYSVTITVL